MSGITTHVLDTGRGLPAGGVPVTLQRVDDNGVAAEIGNQETDVDGRAWELHDGALLPGRYRLVFDTATYYGLLNAATQAFFPVVTIEFTVRDASAHYHVPLLLSPFGYSTYRGS